MSAKFSHFERTDYKIEKFQIGGKWYFWNAEPILWRDTDGVQHIINRGFISDGYSVPSPLWIVIRGLTSVLAAIWHDLAYLIGIQQDIADDGIRAGIIQTHQPECWWPWYRRKIYSVRIRYNAFKVWLGLRMGGGPAWRKYDAMRKAGIDVERNRYATSLEEAKEKAAKL